MNKSDVQIRSPAWESTEMSHCWPGIEDFSIITKIHHKASHERRNGVSSCTFAVHNSVNPMGESTLK